MINNRKLYIQVPLHTSRGDCAQAPTTMKPTSVILAIIVGMCLIIGSILAGVALGKAKADAVLQPPTPVLLDTTPNELGLAKDKIEELQSRLGQVEQQNTRLQQQVLDNQSQLQQIQNTPTSDELYEQILYDQSKLTLNNCDEVIDYARDQEDDIEDDIDDKKKELLDEQQRLEGYNAELVAAAAEGDVDRIRRLNDKTDRAEDEIDDIEDSIDNLDEDYSRIKRLRVKATYECRDIERRL